MSIQLTEEQLAIYKKSAIKRQQQQQEKLKFRYLLGREVAAKAARVLKEEFGASKVVLFGSMLQCDRIHERSDIDLAVWGLNPQVYYRAVGQLLSLEPAFLVDLVEAEVASFKILVAIEREGVVL